MLSSLLILAFQYFMPKNRRRATLQCLQTVPFTSILQCFACFFSIYQYFTKKLYIQFIAHSQLFRFSACNIESWEWAWGRANLCSEFSINIGKSVRILGGYDAKLES